MDPSQGWIEELADLREAGRPCAVVVVTGARGSAPREAGARMIVADGEIVWGTIGGGNLERLAIEHAGALLADGRSAPETVEFPLSEKAGQCCGGVVTLFFEPFSWRRRRVVVFGAGHVGQALASLAPWLRADVLLVDGRDEDEIRPRVPPAGQRPYELLCIDAPEAEVDEVPADSLAVVMTHSHALDLEIVERAIRRGAFPYLGLIGSERKWERFRKQLARKGLTEEEIARVRCPIGATKGSKDPRSIALSVAAELAEELERAPV